MTSMMGPGANASCSWGNESVWDKAALALPGHVTDHPLGKIDIDVRPLLQSCSLNNKLVALPYHL
jgi:hypothetical protein